MITMRDIAERTGVSSATVSVILSGKGEKLRISEETRSRVLALADKLGYCRNEVARSVATGKSNVVGFLVRNPATEHCARLLDGIMRAAHASDFFVKVIYAKPGQPAKEIVRTCVGQRLAGLITYELSGNELFTELREQTARHNIPLVMAAGNDCDIEQGTRILAGNLEGGRLAFKHLYGLGHRSFLVVQEYCDAKWSAMRVGGFSAAAAEAGILIPKANAIQTKGTVSVKCDALTRRLKTTGTTGIFCVSDYSALAILSLLQSAGIIVPGDISVMGYGNLSFGLHTRPRLTSVEEHMAGIGTKAMHVLLGKIESGKWLEETENHLEYFGTSLVARGSTGPICQNARDEKF